MNASKARKYLQERVSGDVLWDRDVLRFYSVDASSYQVIPRAVVIPKDEGDVVSVVKFARRFRTSVTARGAGTGLVGGSLNDGIVLDMRNFDSIKVRKRFAVVGPGASKGKLDEELQRHGKFFSPNPSIGRYCSVGGMLGNNAGGSRGLKYGSTIDNVLEITFIDGNGNRVTLPQDAGVGKKILALAKGVDRGRIPDITKNSSGYRIDRVDSANSTHSAIVGSEGTLGVIISAKLKIRDIPKKRALYIVEYDSAISAAENCPDILKTGPAAVEFVDAQTMRNFSAGFSTGAGCLLFIEYDSDLSRAHRQIRRTATGCIRQRTGSERGIRQWWRYRDMSLHYSLKSVRPEDRVPHVIEDAAVPVKNLAGLFKVIGDVNRKFKTEAITYGHAGDGNIHVRLLLAKAAAGKGGGGRGGGHDPRVVREIAKYYFKRVIGLGGSISGEHGDGLARTGFVRSQYGPRNYRVFVRLKNILDPHNVLNPGKIISQ